MISLYMYGADDVFAMEKSTFMKWVCSVMIFVGFRTWGSCLFVDFYHFLEDFAYLVLLYLCPHFHSYHDLQVTNFQRREKIQKIPTKQKPISRHNHKPPKPNLKQLT